ncbi:MAG: ABC transporter substrate-binding protein [Acidimicrobiales bacterium]|nr:ABC transporter substrate-binding protein [Acidimicrobiales bacterium]
MRKRRHLLRLSAVLLAVGLVAAACGDDDDTSSTEQTNTTEASSDTTAAAAADRGNVNGTLEVGALLPETGQLAAIIDSLRTPIDIAVEEINAAGGVLGADVVLVAADDGTDPQVASASLDQLLNSDKVDVVLGPASSGTMLGIVDKVRTEGVVVCSGSTTAAELSTADDGGFFFRTAPPDSLQGPALADLIVEEGATAVGIIVRNDSYGVGFGDALQTALEEAGATVTANVAYDPNGTDFDADVQQIIDSGPDAVAVIGFNDDGGKIIATMIEKGAGPADIPIFTADGMQGSSFFEAVDATNPAVVEGIKGTAPAAAPATGNPESPFYAAFDATGVDPIFSAYYYDCAIVTALAAQAAGSDDPAAIKDAMVEVTTGGTTCTTYADCLALLDEGEDIDYDGASGSLDFTDVGEPSSGAYDRWAYDAAGSPTNFGEQIVIEASS